MKTQQAGFTLIELVIVIVVLGILAAVAVPQFTDLSTQAEEAVADAAAGAISSQAAIKFAENNGNAATFGTISSAVQKDGWSLVSGGDCTNYAIEVNGNEYTGYSLTSSLCS